MYEQTTLQTPQWKYVMDPENPNRAIGVMDTHGKTTIERTKVLETKQARSKNTSICPQCQRDRAVVQAMHLRRKLCDLQAAHTGLSQDTFMRDKEGKPTVSDREYSRARVASK